MCKIKYILLNILLHIISIILRSNIKKINFLSQCCTYDYAVIEKEQKNDHKIVTQACFTPTLYIYQNYYNPR